MKFNYDSYTDANGYRWLSYYSQTTGIRRYVAQQTLDGTEVYLSGGVPIPPPPPPNSPPVAGTPTMTADASTGVVTGNVNATDPNQDPLTYSASSPTTDKGSVSVTAAGAFTYAPTATARHNAARDDAAPAAKSDTFTVNVSDGRGGTALVAVTTPVTPANNAPVAGPPTVGSPNASTGVVTGTVAATDADKDPLVYSTAASTAKGSVKIDATTGAFTYTPTPTARANAGNTAATAADKADSFTVTVTDGFGGSAAVAVNVVVSPTNSPPQAGTPSMTTNASGVVTGKVNAIDPNNDRVTYTAATTTTTKGTVSVTSAGAFTYTPTPTARHAAAKITAPEADKTDTFTVSVSDSKGATASIPVTVTISPANKTPSGAKATLVAPDSATGVVTGTVTVSDADSDPLNFAAPASTTKGTVSINATTGAFTYTPTATTRHAAAKLGASSTEKSDSFTVTVSDQYGGTVSVPVSVRVIPSNAAPTATAAVAKPDPVSGVATGAVATADADQDTLTYTATKPANGDVVVNADGTFTYTPTAAARTAARSSTTAKTDSFTITVADGYGGTKAVSVKATIAPSDTAPVAGTPSIGPADASTGVIIGTVVATDPEKDALTYTASATAKGTVSITNTGAFTYTPTATARHDAATGAAGLTTDTVTVTVTDKYGAATTIPVTLTISPTNQAPTASASAGSPNASGVVAGTVTASDPDADPLTYSAPGSTAKGSVSIAADGNFTYTPTDAARRQAAVGSDADRQDNFTVTVADGHGGTVNVPVNVTVRGSETGLSWPLSSVSVTRGFGNGHDGIDLKAGNRTPVYAAADGVIFFEGFGTSDRAGKRSDWMGTQAGICILVWHPTLNIYTGYAHLNSTVIDNGQTVAKGQLIGYSGYTGYVIPAGSGGAHLHFEVLPNNPNFGNGYAGRIDPLPYIK